MCGRITQTTTDPEVLQKSFDLKESPKDLSASYNVAPSQQIGVVALDAENARQYGTMRWGLIPSWAKEAKIGHKLINARGETVHEKPSFRSAFRKRRCLIVATGFYEWHKEDDGSKTPMFIHLTDQQPFGMAGLWERWTEPETGEIWTTCTIITTTPNDLMRNIHNRMPVILPRDAYGTWLDRSVQDPDVLRPLIAPYTADNMAAYPVSTDVNNPRNNHPDLIEPAA